MNERLEIIRQDKKELRGHQKEFMIEINNLSLLLKRNPNAREIAEYTDLSLNAVNSRIVLLKNKGLMEHIDKGYRLLNIPT